MLKDLEQATEVHLSLPQGEAGSTKTERMTVKVTTKKIDSDYSYDSEDFSLVCFGVVFF